MSGKYGVSELWPVVAVGIEMGNVGDAMGRLKGSARYFKLMSLMDELMVLPSVDWTLMKEQAKELDPADMEELKAKAKEKFDIVDGKLELAIEQGLDLAYRQYEIVVDSIKLVKDMKEA